jgi:hypothetical protein
MTSRQPEPAPRTAPARRRDAGRAPARDEPWERIGWHPDHVIEIAISAQLRQRDPGRPLSLLEALDIGRAAASRQAAPEPEPEAEAEP